VEVGSQKLKPNFYLLILAGSTVGRISTGVNFAKKFLGQLEDHLKAPHSDIERNSFNSLSENNTPQVKFLMPDSGSLEGLIEAMREPGIVLITEKTRGNKTQRQEQEQKDVLNSGLAVYSEFASFLDMTMKEYNKGYESFIIDCYDGNDHTR